MKHMIYPDMAHCFLRVYNIRATMMVTVRFVLWRYECNLCICNEDMKHMLYTSIIYHTQYNTNNGILIIVRLDAFITHFVPREFPRKIMTSIFD